MSEQQLCTHRAPDPDHDCCEPAIAKNLRGQWRCRMHLQHDLMMADLAFYLLCGHIPPEHAKAMERLWALASAREKQ